MKANERVRRIAKESNVFLWEVGAQLGVTEMTVVRWLRTPLSSEKEQAILSAIQVISKRKGGDFCNE